MEMEKNIIKDETTGLYSTAFFHQELSIFFKMAVRHGNIFSLMIVDINNFRKINEKYDYNIGNQILAKTAEILKTNFRESDIITRYGGDEFAVIMPETNESVVPIIIERLRSKENMFIEIDSGEKISFNLNIGVSQYNEQFQTPDDIFEFVDDNMYKDKMTKEL